MFEDETVAGTEVQAEQDAGDEHVEEASPKDKPPVKKEKGGGEAEPADRDRAQALEEERNLLMRERDVLRRQVLAAREVASPSGDARAFEQASLTVMTEILGMSQAEARQQLREMREAEEGEGEEEAPRKGRQGGTGDRERERGVDREYEQRLERLEKDQQDLEYKRLETETEGRLREALDQSPEVATLLKKVRENGRQPDNLVKNILSDARREMKAVLRERFEKSGRSWDDSWIQTAAAKGMKAAYAKYQSAIEALAVDAGRASETDAGQEILKRKPLNPPTEQTLSEKGRDKTRQELKDWAVNRLLRAASGVNGESNI